MRRCTLNVFAVVSAFLCVGTIWFRITTRPGLEEFLYVSRFEITGNECHETEWHVSRIEGVVALTCFQITIQKADATAMLIQNLPRIGWHRVYLGTYHPPHLRSFDIGHGKSSGSIAHTVQWFVQFPICFATSIIALPPLFDVIRIIIKLRQKRGGAAGLCKNCGYDLRATPALCPECGTPKDSSCLGANLQRK